MSASSVVLILALLLVLGGALYIRLRWQRAPQAYKAIIAISVIYFTAGALIGGWLFKPAKPPESANRETPTSVDRSISASLPAASQTGAKVIAITDGDTVDVLEANGQSATIRLAGIDAPEHNQAFGPESTEHLASLIADKTITLDCSGDQSYGRLICKILLSDGEDVCLDQVKAGLAWHYKQYQDEQLPTDRITYAAAECTAMKARLGLWSDPHPVQPQDFRHGTSSQLLLDDNGCRTSSEPSTGAVVGNARSRIFEWPACPYYAEISPENRVSFPNPQAAEAAGYRPAHNCP